MKKASTAVFFTVALSLLGTGCSSIRLVDSEVNSFARWTPAPPARGATYRFERLPSQQSQQSGELPQEQIEAMARSALDKVGLVNNPAAAAFNVQIGASTSYAQRYPYDSYGGPGVSLGAGSGGGFLGLSFPLMRHDPPLYKREVSVVMRDARSNAVVYETRAAHSGVWGDASAVLPAMFDAALRGFPAPPPGPRRVDIEIPR